MGLSGDWTGVIEKMELKCFICSYEELRNLEKERLYVMKSSSGLRSVSPVKAKISARLQIHAEPEMQKI